MALIVWPTVAAPVRNIGLAIGNGVELANAQPPLKLRFVFESLPSDRITAYIRNHTAVDARVFSPHPNSMTFATGRPNASGFSELLHQSRADGPEYRDVLSYLEAAAIQRRGFEYVHAPDEWVEGLPKEALRQAVPESATVFLLPYTYYRWKKRGMIRAASALSHTRLRGVIDPAALHLRTPWRAEPLGDHVPDLVIAPAQFVPWMFPPASRQPIWWNDETAVYALDGAVDPITPPRAEPFPFSVRVSDARAADGRIAFTATFDDRAADRWTSQDWVLIATQAPPWNLPTQLLPDGTPPVAMWFVSYLNPGKGTSSLVYEFDFLAPRLAVRREHGVLKPLDRSEAVLDSGSYLLAVRLRHEYKAESMAGRRHYSRAPNHSFRDR